MQIGSRVSYTLASGYTIVGTLSLLLIFEGVPTAEVVMQNLGSMFLPVAALTKI